MREEDRRQLAESLACLPVDPTDIDSVEAALDEWHDHAGQLTGLSVHEYLGWSWEQFRAWMSRPVVSPDEMRWWLPTSG